MELLTAQQFERRGVVVDHRDGRPHLKVPASVGPTLAAEIDRRAPKLKQLPPARGPRQGACDVCLEPLPAHVGGTCWLCVVAHYKAAGL